MRRLSRGHSTYPGVGGSTRRGSATGSDPRLIRSGFDLLQACRDSLTSRAPTWPVGSTARKSWLYRADPGCSTPLPEGLRLYGLRQTAASMRIREGTSVKAVQRQLGHAAASTLDTYGHLFPDELEELAGRVDRTAPRR
jgi:integrase